ncbi:MAG: molybdopterin molybdenumtransferase MoeA [Alphaproteobacteria bacterium]|nr:MAG: molybdopterin molybdenumtransferase MoeA [Alphaproteobacteria bacterium]
MISYQEAYDIVIKAAQARVMRQEMVDLSAITGYIAAEDMSAPLAIQPFDNSAMDGFAVMRADLEGANENNAALLRVAGMVAAGDNAAAVQIARGTCARIMTGAPVPEGADAVVPVELTEMRDDAVVFKACPHLHDNIRMAGEDFQVGDNVLTKGQKLSAAHILPLASLGIGQVKVFSRARAAFLATGKELVDDLTQPLPEGQIYNTNGPYGVAVLKTLGADCVVSSTIPDEEEAFIKTLEALMAQDLDLVISSGAVSAGEFDFVKAGLEKIGAEILFHKVRMKPGKPNLFARLPNGSLYFGLPGNPAATAVGLRFFVAPALRAMTGQAREISSFAIAETPFKKKPGLSMFLKAVQYIDDEGRLRVSFADGQQSFMVHPFLTANAWAVVPEEATEIRAEERAEIYPLFS